jgi:hypothetical protein
MLTPASRFSAFSVCGSRTLYFYGRAVSTIYAQYSMEIPLLDLSIEFIYNFYDFFMNLPLRFITTRQLHRWGDRGLKMR